MAEFKLVIGDPKTGKTVQKEAKENAADAFLGLKIGQTVKGEVIDLTGYEFEITGGSDYAGFPMRKDVPGQQRKRILAVTGVGVNNKKKYRKPKKKGMRTMKGMRSRKMVAGNTVYERTAQINLKVLKAGKGPLVEAPAPEAKPEGEAAPAEGKKPEAKAPKEAPKKEEAKPAETKPAEEKKPEEKKE